jgi:dihydropyrimidinase
MSKILIQNVKVINPDSVRIADILVEDDRIISVVPHASGLRLSPDPVGANSSTPHPISKSENRPLPSRARNFSGTIIIDGTGLLAFPGFIDFHVHLEDRIGEFRIADTYEHGSKVALRNGITTICSFITQAKGETLKQTVERNVKHLLPSIHTDIHWHLTPTTFSNEDLREIEELIEKGFTTFKFYTTYKKNGLFADYDSIRAFAHRFREKGITILVHCQDDAILHQKEFGNVADIESVYSQASELKAVHEIAEIADETGVHFHIVHVSNAESVVRKANVTYETAPQYLNLTDKVYKYENGYQYLCSPWFGSETNRKELLKLVRNGEIDLLATDHCPFTKHDKAKYKYELGRIPNGLCGLDYLVPLAFNAVNPQSDEDYSLLCRLLSTNPAGILGMGDYKGRIAEGFQADIVLLKRGDRHSLPIRENLFNPYDGIESDVTVIGVIRRGLQ